MTSAALPAMRRATSCFPWLAIIAASASACRLQDDIIAQRQGSATGGGAPQGGAAGSAGLPVDVGDVSPGGAAGSGGLPVDVGGASPGGAAGSGGLPVEKCDGFSPTLSVSTNPGQEQDVCAGWLASRAFAHAVCSCGDLGVLAVLASDARDSRSEDRSSDRRGAAVGVNGNYAGGELIRIGGSLTVAGRQPLVSRGGIDVAGDLRLAPPTTASGPIFVGRDAWLLEKTSSRSIATIGRNLHLGSTGKLDAPGAVLVLGATSNEALEVSPPCACDERDRIDVARIVDGGLARNDNSRVRLALDALSGGGGTGALSLSCGRFALRSIEATASTLRISGRVLLFIDGDVDLGRSFSLSLGPRAELDWFIRGNFKVSGEALLGDDSRPGAIRIYVMGNEAIALPGTARFSANVYAPRAKLAIGALGDVHGALFGAEVTSLGPLLSHYDRSVLRADEDCALRPQQCSGCEQCGTGSACVGSACAPCTADQDCCFPLVCDTGACTALPVE